MFLIKQLSFILHNERATLAPCDFCTTKKLDPTSEWLNNKNGNGWKLDNSAGAYTEFKLAVWR